MIPRKVFLLLAALAAFAPLAIDLYLPSLGAIAADLNAPAGRVQQTVSVFLGGFALGVLFYGPLSDRFGRRRVILSGTTLFVLASVACTLAQTVEQLLLFRALQAFGGGAAAVVSRAVIRDLFSENEAAKVMAMVGMVTSLAPMVAPLLGAAILELGSWRYEFAALTVFGLACMVGTHRLLPETLSTGRSQATIALAFQGYLTVLESRSARRLIGAGACHFAAMFAYITASPFVYIQMFGLSETTYGLLFAANIAGLMGFGYASARLVDQAGTARLAAIGAWAALFGAMLVVMGGWNSGTSWINLSLIASGLLVAVGALGLVAPNTVAQLLGAHPNNAGAASALYGFAQFGLGGVASLAVSLTEDGSAKPMAALVFGFLLVAAFLAQGNLRAGIPKNA